MAAGGLAIIAMLPVSGAAVTGSASPAESQRYIVVSGTGNLSDIQLPVAAQVSADRYPGVAAVVAELTARQAAAVNAQPGVIVARDGRVSAIPITRADDRGDVSSGGDASPQATASSWGLDRIDQRNLPLSQTYSPHLEVDGEGVHAFVIDTGLAGGHPEFAGRVGNGTDIVAADNDPEDCHGHGSHVAGTIGSYRYGVAPRSILHGVRVLDCDGFGTWSGVIAGMEWVVRRRLALGHTVVANMSLGGEFNPAANAATANMVHHGVVTAVAAGNSADDACNYSPASTPEALTVAASDREDHAASWFSNFGACVDLYAPGEDIESTNAVDPTEGVEMTGTSMASPHIAGWAALYLSLYPDATPDQTRHALLDSGTTRRIIGAPRGTPNILPYTQDLIVRTKATLTVVSRAILWADVDPNSTLVNYRVQGQKQQSGRWVTKWAMTTNGDQETLRRNVAPGTWRLLVPAQHGQLRALSNAVRVA